MNKYINELKSNIDYLYEYFKLEIKKIFKLNDPKIKILSKSKKYIDECLNNNNCEKLEPIAQILNKDVKDYANSLLNNYKKYIEKSNYYFYLLDVFYILANEKIKELENLDEVTLKEKYKQYKELLIYIKNNVSLSTTVSDIVNMFKNI